MDKELYQHIDRPGDRCVQCEVLLDGFARHPSALSPGAEKAVRSDLCPACWDKMDPGEYFSFWLARREQKAPEPKASKREVGQLLLELFQNLRETEDARFHTHLYVLAHLLMKMKTFKWVKTVRRQDQADLLVFRDETTKEELDIEDIALEDEALLEAKKEIDTLLATINSQPHA